MIDMKIDQAKRFFFDREKIVAAVDKATRDRLSLGGRILQMAARKLIRKAPQKRIADLTEKQRDRYYEAFDKWRDGGKVGPKPRRPTASSRPGEPPRSQTGLLRKFLLFVIDLRNRSVVVGPALINKPTGAPRILEYGGTATINGRTVAIAPRPFMAPAYEIVRAKLVNLWRDAVRPAA